MSDKKKLSVDEVNEGFIQPIIDLLNQGLSQVDNETCDLVIEQFKLAANKLNSNEELDISKILHSVTTIAKTSSSLTPTQKDDKAVAVVSLVLELIAGKSGLLALFQLGKTIKEAKKAE